MQYELKWRYYNHAIIPTVAPHEAADERSLQDADIWKPTDDEGRPLLARWTSDFDSPEPTDWWYIIKDIPFRLSDVKANYRYKINKGLKHFDVRAINPLDYAEGLYQVNVEAQSSYPVKNRRIVDRESFIEGLKERRGNLTLAAFSKDSGIIAGYIFVDVHAGYVSLSVQKARPSQEKHQVNAALVYSMLDYFQWELSEGIYIMDGERSIFHETNFQDYLVKYFGFRKAYSRLHIRYRGDIRLIIDMLYPLRKMFRHFSNSRLLSQISSVLTMEEIARKNRNSGSLKEA